MYNNPWYNRVSQPPIQQSYQPPINNLNPIQKVNMVRQAMSNPAAFLKQAFPDIPDEMMNDPNRILGYLQQSRGITNQQIQQLQNSIPRW